MVLRRSISLGQNLTSPTRLDTLVLRTRLGPLLLKDLSSLRNMTSCEDRSTGIADNPWTLLSLNPRCPALACTATPVTDGLQIGWGSANQNFQISNQTLIEPAVSHGRIHVLRCERSSREIPFHSPSLTTIFRGDPVVSDCFKTHPPGHPLAVITPCQVCTLPEVAACNPRIANKVRLPLSPGLNHRTLRGGSSC